MTEIPEHLLNRKKMRDGLGTELGKPDLGLDGRQLPEHLSGPSDDSRIPQHLRRSSRGKPPAQLKPSDIAAEDPFAAKKRAQEAAASNLLRAKAGLLLAVHPVRAAMEGTDSTLKAQFLNSESLVLGANFTPGNTQGDIGAYLTVYGNKEVFGEVEGGKAWRAGEQRAWRMPVGKRELGGLLGEAGQKRMRDTWRIARGRSVIVGGGDITSKLAALVFESATAERVTDSVTLFEGEPNRQAYDASYGNRYAAAVSVTRNPADTKEEEGVFGADFLSLYGSHRVDEGQPDDGSLYEGERTVRLSGISSIGRRPSPEALEEGFISTGHVMGVFTELIADPSRSNAVLTCRAIDRHIRNSRG